ncbi:actin-related protein 8 [Malaya genurostris]|uniref:actin-related protein 8 n=1 Tax=Malaya genurostris TaxID=325434 RepID=UPI0026F3D5E3|nr:actin-related protein 8 [Malaya genurostris]
MANSKDTPEHLQAQNIIVIHPGSLYLRVGRASDVNPSRILHAIARRRKPGGQYYRDIILPPPVTNPKESLSEFEECRLQVSHTLQSCVQSDGRRRYATPPQQISAFNRRSTAEPVEGSQIDFKDAIVGDTVIGEEVLWLNPEGEFNLHFPIKRGELNLHKDIGGSLTGVIADLQEIWEYVLKNRLKIDLKQLRNYKAVLVIPDIYNRAHLKEFTTLLLNKIGFGYCFLLQDHVAATFGAGLGYACVVDVGDQKTSVSCVEDGISHPNTRVRLDYGGADVTQTFFWMLQKCAFPYKECDQKTPLDVVLLKQLKEEYCHVNLDVCGSLEKSFTVQRPQQGKYKYTLQVGDEAIVAPLALFYTELFSVTGVNRSVPKTQKPSTAQSHPEDCFDAEYLRETGRRGKENLEQTANESGLGNQENPDEEMVVDGLEQEREGKLSEKDFILPSGQVIGIDQAILQSIERCPNDELKRKMYGCILVVGGGMKFTGISNWLQNRVALKIPLMYRSEHNIVTSSKDIDQEITSWKGAAIMSCLESAGELWLTEPEWSRYGLRILREKAVFMW